MRRVLLVGNCIFDGWREVLETLQPGVQVDHFAFNQADPGTPEDADYDVRIVQVPFRIVHSEWRAMQLAYNNPAEFEQAFAVSVDSMRAYIDMAGRTDSARPTFFLNYLAPQQNAYGRLLPRYDLRNPVHFVERLNQALAQIVESYPGGYLLDADQIAATLGRRSCQDDAFWVTAHGGLIHDADWEKDRQRLEPSQRLSERYAHDTRGFIGALWGEAHAMLRTLRGLDRIKMVCVDLDDTLWRGVLAEESNVDFGMVEGWPLGFAEALYVLGQRGVILAIISRNDPARIAELWPHIYGPRFSLETFPIRKIGWGAKADSLRDAIAEANVLPDSVLFIDDNPVERAHAEAALPGLRTLGGPHLDWRRILLWSPETQVAEVTDESARRNAMMAGQVAREERRTNMSREAFLQDLQVAVELERIASPAHPRFGRALELVNRTNQFNTTGQRWTQAEAEAYFASGGGWTVFSVHDRYVQYGLVGVLIARADSLDQYVMSCRVFALGVEEAALREFSRRHAAPLQATLVETPKNGPCRHVFKQAGWRQAGDVWMSGPLQDGPSHVRVAWAGADGATP